MTLAQFSQHSESSKAIWPLITGNFKTAFGEEIYNKWFTKIELHSYSEHEAIMAVPSKFLRDWIKREYLNKNLKTHKNITEIWLEHNPNLKRISVIYLEPENTENNNNESSKTTQNKANKDIISISKHDNVFSFGIELNEYKSI